MKYNLSDDVIAAIARSLQLSMLTGTDCVDHLRLLEVEPGTTENTLTLTPECVERMERNVADLLVQADRLHTESLAQKD